MLPEQRTLLVEVFTEVFELGPDAAVEEARQGETTAWDSLGHVSLIAALESEFGVEINAADSIEITSFTVAEEILAELLAE